MIELLECKTLLRAVTVFTLLTFFPTAVQAWNFVPPAEEAAEAVPAEDDALAPVEAETETGPALSLLTEDQMREAASGPPPIPIREKRTLPDAKILLASLKDPEPDREVQIAYSPETTRPASTQVAEASDALTQVGEEEQEAVVGGQMSAAPMLTTADNLFSAGKKLEAALAYVDMIDAYPASRQAYLAWKRYEYNIIQKASGAELDEIEAALPSWESLTSAEGRYPLVLLHFNRARDAAKQSSGSLSESTSAQIGKFRDAVERFLTDFPTNPLQQAMVKYYAKVLLKIPDADRSAWEAHLVEFWPLLIQPQSKIRFYQWRAKIAEKEGRTDATRQLRAQARETARQWMLQQPENAQVQVDVFDYYEQFLQSDDYEHAKAMADMLEEIISENDPSIMTWIARMGVAYYHVTRGHNRGGALWHYACALDEPENGYVDEALNNPNVDTLCKTWMEHQIGLAWYVLGHKEEALEQFERSLQRASEEPDWQRSIGYPRKVAFGAGYSKARTIKDLNRDNLYVGITAFQDYLNEFPDSKLAPRALLDIGTCYFQAEDFDGALQVYREVIQKYPGSVEAGVAEQEINYILTNLYDSVEVWPEAVAQAEQDEKVAQLCGPIALQKLLAMKGLETTVDELAQLAGADETGTTMLGLVEAARAKGLDLVGVESADLEGLSTPFIAYVNNNHFLLVTDVGSDTLVVEDVSRPAATIALAEFMRDWDGKALVTSKAQEVAKLLDLQAMMGAKGGSQGSGAGSGDDDEDDDDDDGDGCLTSALLGPTGSDPQNTDPDKNHQRIGPGAPDSPEAFTGISVPGVNARINTFKTGLILDEKDTETPVRGAMSLLFRRYYNNPKGFPREEFTSTGRPYKNNIGSGWTHNLNMHLYASSGTTPSWVEVYDEAGYARVYEFDHTAGGYNYYYRSDTTGHTREQGNTLKRATTNPKKYTLEKWNGITYEFTTAQTTARVARLTAIKDRSGNAITLKYDDPGVSVGKLTKAKSPSGTLQQLVFSYDGNLITKVEQKKQTALLQTITYAYDGNDELTKVTDNAGNTVQYAYDSNSSASGSRFITKITDKRGNDTDLTWSFIQSDGWQAKKIDFDNAEGLRTTYDRSVSTSICTITNLDGETQLSKIVHTPRTDDPSRSRYKDYYKDVTNYERWIYEYDSNLDFTKLKAPGSITYATRSYTDLGRPSTLSIGSGDGGTSTYSYDTSGLQPTKRTSTATLDTLFYYDSNDRLTKTVPPEVGSAGYVYAYDTNGLMTSSTDPLDNDTTYAYDTLGNMTSVTDPESNTTTMWYDDLGNVTKQQDPRGKDTYFYYDYSGCSGCGASGGVLTKIKDALNNETEFRYDKNGNQTKVINVIDGPDLETDYFYDDMNQLTKVEFPSGSGNTMTTSYDLLGRVTSTTDFEGKTTYFYYDHMGRPTKVTDPVGDVEYTYDSTGLLSTVTDAANHVTDYDYDGAFRLIKVTDAEGKVTKYFYDSAGRVTKVGAGSDGSVDPTEHFYSATTGLVSKVEYHSGQNSYDANYFYDAAAQLTKITDWVDDYTNGIRYAYDDGGRLTKITDYDDSHLDYTYDGNGNVLTMNYDHSSEITYTTTYTYTDTNQVSTITAPDDTKEWDFDYNALGQRTQYSYAEGETTGMTTVYSYDNRNRLTKIEHKDGETVKDSFAYDLEDMGNITKTTHADGAYWQYWYDGRYRLTKAERYNKSASPTITATYEYTYDNADNLLTKVGPFLDDFNDGDYSGWTVQNGTWSAANGYLTNASAAYARIKHTQTDGDIELRFKYLSADTSDNNYVAVVEVRFVNASNRVRVHIKPQEMALVEFVSGVSTTLDTNTSATTTQDTWYEVYVKCDGTDIEVWRAAEGGDMTQVLSASDLNVTTTNSLPFQMAPNADYRFDDIWVVSDDLDLTTTFAYNDANELTKVTANGDTTFTYDAWGRMVTKAIGTSFEATYAYRYGDKLYSVTSDFQGEGNVTYQYGGDGKRRERTAGGTTTKYNWDLGWNVINEENSGALTMTYVLDEPMREVGAILADVSGSDPSTGSYRYYSQDNIGSTRRLRDQNKGSLGQYEYTPYGEVYSESGATITHKFTGKAWDDTAKLYPDDMYELGAGRSSATASSRDDHCDDAGRYEKCYILPSWLEEGCRAGVDWACGKPWGRLACCTADKTHCYNCIAPDVPRAAYEACAKQCDAQYAQCMAVDGSASKPPPECLTNLDVPCY